METGKRIENQVQSGKYKNICDAKHVKNRFPCLVIPHCVYAFVEVSRKEDPILGAFKWNKRLFSLLLIMLYQENG